MQAAAPVLSDAATPRRPAWIGYAGAAVLCLAATVLALPLAAVLDSASLVLLFLLAVVLAAARFGRGPALLAAGLGVLLFNLAFVPPRLSLSVADERVYFTFAVMLVVGLVVGQLTAGLTLQAQAAERREQGMQRLYGLARDLGRALTVEQVAELLGSFVQQQMGADVRTRLRPADALARPLAGDGAADAAEAWPHALALPLQGTMAVRGTLDVARPGAGSAAWSDEERQLLQTCAALAGSTLERLHYIEVARDSAVQIEGERLRSSLLAAVSHDLRTPLASLVGLSEALHLTRPPLSAQQGEIATAMAGTARRMSEMVHKLLDMARLESGAVRLDRQWQPLEEVIGSALAASEPVLPPQRVHVEVAADLPLVRIDAVLMERALVNLLENAARHAPAASCVRIEARRDGAEMVLAVVDDGPGLPPGRPEDLFRKFERGHREGTGAGTGVGLGLALCQAIAKAHGAGIAACNEPAGGARFELRWPFEPAPALAPEPASEPPAAWSAPS